MMKQKSSDECEHRPSVGLALCKVRRRRRRVQHKNINSSQTVFKNSLSVAEVVCMPPFATLHATDTAELPRDVPRLAKLAREEHTRKDNEVVASA